MDVTGDVDVQVCSLACLAYNKTIATLSAVFLAPADVSGANHEGRRIDTIPVALYSRIAGWR